MVEYVSGWQFVHCVYPTVDIRTEKHAMSPKRFRTKYLWILMAVFDEIRLNSNDPCGEN